MHLQFPSTIANIKPFRLYKYYNVNVVQDVELTLELIKLIVIKTLIYIFYDLFYFVHQFMKPKFTV